MSLLKFLKENEKARKIFGKRELKIIEKQLQGVNLTQSEKNRLSRDIRPKFQFIKDAARFELEFNLKKGQIIKDKIEEAKEAIFESKHLTKIKRIVLFGSAAERQLSLRSDIDIAVEFDEIDEKEAAKFRISTLGKVPDKIDIQVYNILPDKIKKEIDEKGKVIYEKWKIE